MLSDVEAGETSQAGVLDQAGSVDLPFVKSGAAGQAGSAEICREIHPVENCQTKQLLIYSAEGCRRLGLE